MLTTRTSGSPALVGTRRTDTPLGLGCLRLTARGPLGHLWLPAWAPLGAPTADCPQPCWVPMANCPWPSQAPTCLLSRPPALSWAFCHRVTTLKQQETAEACRVPVIQSRVLHPPGAHGCDSSQAVDLFAPTPALLGPRAGAGQDGQGHMGLVSPSRQERGTPVPSVVPVQGVESPRNPRLQ